VEKTLQPNVKVGKRNVEAIWMGSANSPNYFLTALVNRTKEGLAILGAPIGGGNMWGTRTQKKGVWCTRKTNHSNDGKWG